MLERWWFAKRRCMLRDAWLPMPADWVDCPSFSSTADSDPASSTGGRSNYACSRARIRRIRAIEWLDGLSVPAARSGLVCALNTGTDPVPLPRR